ncbi:MAG: dihydrolipoyl dehydrogenase [Eubacteriales bacterium]|jgi:dihydrolipoamide dehydrogenase
MVFDVIVLGGGPGGYLAAERAGQAGLKAAVIEKRALGGVCLNEGCIPSKTLLQSAKLYDYAKGYSKKYGVSSENAKIDQNFVIDRKNKVVKTLVSGVEMTMKANKVTVVKAEGMIKGRTAEGFEIVAGGESYVGKNLIIATGSTAFVPPIDGAQDSLKSGFAMTNREILDLREIPNELVVIGGGVIGLEMASYYNSVGSKVTVVEMLDKIAGPNDREISALLQKNYEKKGITFELSAKVTAVKDGGVTYEKDGKVVVKKCDKVLLSIGRRAVTQGFGLENIHVMTDRPGIVVDSKMQTNVPGVYAIGDCTGKSMLAHSAYRGAEVAINNILGKKDHMRYNAVPGVIYTNPEVGSVGITEDTAKERGIPYRVVKLPMSYSGRYIAENEGGDGIAKFIINTKYNTLIGAHILGNPASEFIMSCVMMVESEMTIDQCKEFIFPHPTVCEIVREGLFH